MDNRPINGSEIAIIIAIIAFLIIMIILMSMSRGSATAWFIYPIYALLR